MIDTSLIYLENEIDLPQQDIIIDKEEVITSPLYLYLNITGYKSDGSTFKVTDLDQYSNLQINTTNNWITLGTIDEVSLQPPQAATGYVVYDNVIQEVIAAINNGSLQSFKGQAETIGLDKLISILETAAGQGTAAFKVDQGANDYVSSGNAWHLDMWLYLDEEGSLITSESLSEILSESTSLSESASISESLSLLESTSESLSESISESLSESATESESLSLLESESKSITESQSTNHHHHSSTSVSVSASTSESSSESEIFSESIFFDDDIGFTFIEEEETLSTSVSDTTSTSESESENITFFSSEEVPLRVVDPEFSDFENPETGEEMINLIQYGAAIPVAAITRRL
jgi:hypothetical protein